MSQNRLHKSPLNDQSGFVAIISCLLMSIILTVITVSFIRIMTREQRQALDSQLSTQAFYAAESGANYAVFNNIANKTTCDTSGFGTIGPGIDITCLLVNENPEELVFDGINPDQPTIFAITKEVSELTFYWEGPTGQESDRDNTPGDPKFFNNTEWGSDIGVVEVVIYPIKDPINIDKLRTLSRTFYLYPNRGGGGETVDYSTDGSTDGQIVKAHCDLGVASTKPKDCFAKITGLAGIDAAASGPTQGYVLRLRSIYNPVSLLIDGQDAGGTTVSLDGAQRVIDVTGKASDVLRRIQIRLPIRPGYALPIFALEAGHNLCKQQDVYPGGGSEDPACL